MVKQEHIIYVNFLLSIKQKKIIIIINIPPSVNRNAPTALNVSNVPNISTAPNTTNITTPDATTMINENNQKNIEQINIYFVYYKYIFEGGLNTMH